MAGYNIDDIVRDVRICLDENDVQNALLADDVQTLMLDDIIKSKVGEAIDGVVVNAPVDLLGAGEAMEITDIEWSGEGNVNDSELRMCRVKKPADMLRLVGAKMPDWDYSVSELTPENTDTYKMQKSKFAGMRGNPQSPIVADVLGGDGRYLELYSSRKRTIEYIRYIKRVSMQDLSADIAIPTALYRVIVYQIAGLTCVALREAEHAQTLFGIADGLLASTKE